MISPVERIYRKKLENRLPSIVNPRHFKEENILPSTKAPLSDLFRLLIKAEIRIEAFRQKLNRLPRFSKKNIFQIIDKFDQNYIVDSDVLISLNLFNFLVYCLYEPICYFI